MNAKMQVRVPTHNAVPGLCLLLSCATVDRSNIIDLRQRVDILVVITLLFFLSLLLMLRGAATLCRSSAFARDCMDIL